MVRTPDECRAQVVPWYSDPKPCTNCVQCERPLGYPHLHQLGSDLDGVIVTELCSEGCAINYRKSLDAKPLKLID